MYENVTLIGGGSMGSAIAAGIVGSGIREAAHVTVCDTYEPKLKELQDSLGVVTCATVAEALAAGPDVVILAVKPYQGQNTGGVDYGNYCIIDHGGGYTTLYGHCRSVYVSKGQKVRSGQRIAEMGSTGTSTGSHLHFEVRKDGSPVNPERYLP